MVAGLKFLSKKGFNPTNHSNQKKVWEREQEDKNQTQRIVERQKQLQREKDDEDLAISRGDIPRVQFLYNDPTQHQQKHQRQNMKHQSESEPVGGNNIPSIVHRQPGDDDAAAVFRQMMWMAESASHEDPNIISTNTDLSTNSDNIRHPKMGTVLQGSSVDRLNSTNDKGDGTTTSATLKAILAASTALEKAVGKKQSPNTALSLQEQMERFPQLKYAPRAKGMNMTDVNVSFKPLGAQIRNVKCLVCGVWGHSKGDRECEQSGWDPFSTKIALLPTKSQSTKEVKTSDREQKSPIQDFDEINKRKPSRDGLSVSSSSSSEDSSRHRSRRRKRDSRRSDSKRNKKSEKDKKSSSRKLKKHSKKHRKDKKSRKRDHNSDSEDHSDDESLIKKKRSVQINDSKVDDYHHDSQSKALSNSRHEEHDYVSRKKRRRLSREYDDDDDRKTNSSDRDYARNR